MRQLKILQKEKIYENDKKQKKTHAWELAIFINARFLQPTDLFCTLI